MPVMSLIDLRRFTLAIAQVTRIQNSLYGGAYTLVGVYLGGGIAAIFTSEAVAATVVVGIIIAYGFVVNDCYDLPRDIITRPNRPLSVGIVSIKSAWLLSGLLVIAALTIAFVFLSLPLYLIALGNILLTTIYSHILKHTLLLGNIAMAILNSSIIIYGSLATGKLSLITITVTIMMFCYILAQEILYAIEDMESDALTGAHTTAVRLGQYGAIQLYSVATLAFGIAAFLPLLFGINSAAYLITVTLFSVIPTFAIMLFVRTSPVHKHISIAGRILKSLWFLGIIPIILLQAASAR